MCHTAVSRAIPARLARPLDSKEDYLRFARLLHEKGISNDNPAICGMPDRTEMLWQRHYLGSARWLDGWKGERTSLPSNLWGNTIAGSGSHCARTRDEKHSILPLSECHFQSTVRDRRPVEWIDAEYRPQTYDPDRIRPRGTTHEVKHYAMGECSGCGFHCERLCAAKGIARQAEQETAPHPHFDDDGVKCTIILE
jgi:hypothetical protein